jgi:hypothetical protein
MKRLAWLVMVVLSLLIIASRKHYTVDVVIAWYVVFLVFNYVDSHLSNTGRFFHHMCVSLSDDHIGFMV